jgi:hypothetical protein
MLLCAVLHDMLLHHGMQTPVHAPMLCQAHWANEGLPVNQQVGFAGSSSGIQPFMD